MLRAYGDQIPLDLGKETEHGHRHLGLDILAAVELDSFFHGNEDDLAFDELVYYLDYLAQAPAQSGELTDDESVS